MFCCHLYSSTPLALIQYDMIGWRNDSHAVRPTTMRVHCSQRNAGSRVAADRLKQHIPGRQVRQLLAIQLLVGSISHDKHLLRLIQQKHSLPGSLQQRHPVQQRHELLWTVRAA